MNAYQRRKQRRSRAVLVFDTEAWWNNLRKKVMRSVRPSLSVTGRSEGSVLYPFDYPYSRRINVLKARPLCDNSTLVFSPDGLEDFSGLEKRIALNL
jgi:hypothetical protein